ncbi:hypothetical protein ACLBWP_16940 [Microbacterium sp. M1A1_1b]
MKKREINHKLDRSLLLGYLTLLVVVLFSAAAWVTIGLARSAVFIAACVAAVGLVVGLLTARVSMKWAWPVGMVLILGMLLVLASISGPGHSYQFAWLFPAIAGLLLAKPVWPWWHQRDGRAPMTSNRGRSDGEA